MDKLEQYRQFVKQILTEHAQIATTTDTVKAELIFDSEHDHYQLAYVGWQGDQDGKIWIQYNGTEDSIAERLVEMGVPNSDIVLGFHSAFKRQFTSYAVG